MGESKDKIAQDLETAGPIENESSQIGEILKASNPNHDAVFGEIIEDGPNYRNVGSLIDPELPCIRLNPCRLDG